MSQSLLGRKIGQYEVLAEMGRGQHSVVYKAWQASLERYVALKVLHRYDPQLLVKFQSEARLTAKLVEQGVPNIRRVYEVGQTADGHLFVALEYVEDSLQAALRRAKKRNRRIQPLAAARMLQPVAQALDAIHSLGWVHLDIKPQNILIARGGRAVLADFGIAQRRGTVTHACTPAYASPEQAAGDQPVGPWSDIYSLGVVFYEMVAGHPPVRGDQDIVLLSQHLDVIPPSPRRVNPDLSPSQERALFKALSKERKSRFTTAGEFVQALMVTDSFLSSVIKTPGSLLATRSRRTRRVGRLVWVIAILALVLVVLLLFGAVVWPGWRVSAPTASPTATMTASAAETVLATSSPTRTSAPVRTPAAPTATVPPTSTLAPTPTWTTRPTAAPTHASTPTPDVSASPEP